MHGDNFTYVLLSGLAIALLIAAFTDLRRRQIDNWLNAAVALSAPLFWWATGVTIGGIGLQFLIALATFGITAGLFAMRAMGGGDVKLLTALALWIPPMLFLKFIIVMSLLGAVLTLIFGAWHIATRQRDRVAIPYGVAISSAGLWALASQYLPPFQAAFQAAMQSPAGLG